MNAEKICVAIKTLRIRKGMTQTQLAERLGVTDKAVSKWERGLGTPDISMLNRLALILDIDTDNLLEGNIAYLENDWVGILDLARFETNISIDTEVYGKPIVYIYLCYFALVGVREIYVNCGNEEEKMRRVVGDGGQYGLRILYNTEPPQESNIMVISGPVFIYGPNLTKYFQRAMSHLAKRTVLALQKKEADMELPHKNQINDISNGKHRYHAIPISFIRSEKSDNSIEYELLGNGMIELEVKNMNDVLDVGFLLRFIQSTSGFAPYCLEEIATRRGLMP